MSKKKTVRSIVVGGALVVGFVMVPRAGEAQVGSTPVRVVNAPDAAVPVQIVKTTVSSRVTLVGGDGSQLVSPNLPACPAGKDFLISDVAAAPDPFNNSNIESLEKWAVRVNTFQRFTGGSASSRPVTVFGNGAQNASEHLAAGQPSPNPNTGEVFVINVSTPPTFNVTYNIHISGYCGVAFVATP